MDKRSDCFAVGHKTNVSIYKLDVVGEQLTLLLDISVSIIIEELSLCEEFLLMRSQHQAHVIQINVKNRLAYVNSVSSFDSVADTGLDFVSPYLEGGSSATGLVNRSDLGNQSNPTKTSSESIQLDEDYVNIAELMVDDSCKFSAVDGRRLM